MSNESQTRIAGLVDTRLLHSFQQATKALYDSLRDGEDEFDVPDVQKFITRHLRETMLWTETEMPPGCCEPLS